jgi:hypothetical protein
MKIKNILQNTLITKISTFSLCLFAKIQRYINVREYRKGGGAFKNEQSRIDEEKQNKKYNTIIVGHHYT